MSFSTFLVVSTSIAICVTSLSPLLSNARARELLLPIMSFPVLYPVITLGLSITEKALNGIVDFYGIQFIIFYSASLFILSLILSDYFF